MSKRVLIVTPWIPFPITGADQQDRYYGFLQLQEAGFEIQVIAKIHAFQDRAQVEAFYKEAGIPLILVPYTTSLWSLLFHRLGHVIREPALLDGAALEYIDEVTESTIRETVATFKPDVAWVEFSFLWPVVRFLKTLNIPTVMRSANNEAQQSIDEHEGKLLYRLLSWPKFRGERIVARESGVVCAITPWEETWYKTCGAVKTMVLPLRGLARTLRHRTHMQKDVLDIVFLSSSYTNGHNRDALKFVLTQIVPAISARAPGQFRFHITGKKFPEAFRTRVTSDVIIHDFIPDLDTFLDTMDVALCPSVSGQGMQQKIFEPLCCGLPLITHHTAGYPFEDGVQVLLAQTSEKYVAHLLALRSMERRQVLSDAAFELSCRLFSAEKVKEIASDAVYVSLSSVL